MLIKSITLENFKGIQEATRIELKPITLLFGANSAGKSTILQALLYAREVLERHNLDPDKTLLGGDLIDLGGFKKLVNQHDLSKDIVIGFELDISNQDLPEYLSDTENYLIDLYQLDSDKWLSNIRTIFLRIRIRWSKILDKPIVKHFSINANLHLSDVKTEKTSEESDIHNSLILITSSDDGKNIVVPTFNYKHEIFNDESHDDNNESEFSSLYKNTLNVLNDSGKDFDEYGGISDFYDKGEYVEFDDSMIYVMHLLEQNDALPQQKHKLVLSRSSFTQEQEESDLNIDVMCKQVFIASIFQRLILGSLEILNDELQKIIHIGPLRAIPERNQSFELRKSNWFDGLAAWKYLYNSSDSFLLELNHWLADKNRLNTGYSVTAKNYVEFPIESPFTKTNKQGPTIGDVQSEFAKAGEDQSLFIADNIFEESKNNFSKKDLINYLNTKQIEKEITLYDLANNLEIHPRDVGVGISQILPVLVAVLMKKSGIISIEQPELHIHPRLQVALGDLFASQVNNEDIDTFYLLETHSEHLMLRLLRRIRETSANELPEGAPSLTPDDVAVLYIESSPDGMKIHNLAIDDEGDFDDEWPAGFFEERDEELFS